MRITLFILSLVAVAAGAAFLSVAQTPIEEIGGLMLFAVAATLLAAAAVAEALARCLRVAELNNELLSTLTAELRDVRKQESVTSFANVANEPAYVVRTGNDSSGPFPVDKIKELRRRGAIDDDTPVALAGRNEWKRTCDVIGLMRQNVAAVSHH